MIRLVLVHRNTVYALTNKRVMLRSGFFGIDFKAIDFDKIQNLEVNMPVQDAKVVINSRTGAVVMNREVMLDNCAVAQGNLSVTVNQQNVVSQPNTPLAGGQTVVTPQTQIDMRQTGGALKRINSSASLNNVVRALNALGATPMDLMSILQAMQSAGCLRAKLEII